MSSMPWRYRNCGGGNHYAFCVIEGHKIYVGQTSRRAKWRVETDEIPSRTLNAKTLHDAQREALELVAQHFDEFAAQARNAIEEVGT